MNTFSHGNKRVLENDHRFLAGKALIAGIDVAFHAARVAGLTAVDIRNAGRIDRQRAHDRVVAILRAEAQRRHHDQPVRVDAPGLVRLGAADIDPFVGAPRDVHEQVGIRLLVRRLGAIALDVRHRPADHVAAALHARHELEKAHVVRGAVRLVDLESHRVKGVDRIHADAALEAGSGELPQAPLHLVLHHQVLGARRHVQEAVDPLTGVGRKRATQLGIARREVVGLRHRVHRRADDGMVDRLGHQLAEQIDLELAPAQARDVFVAGANRRGRLPALDGLEWSGHVDILC